MVEKQQKPLFSEVYGHGDDVVLVHGWGMHCGFWREFAQQLGQKYRVTCLDLPGHGKSPMTDDYSPENIAELLMKSAPDNAHWIGWSLGATLVLYLGEIFSERVKTIGLIAGNPKFSRCSDWLSGLENPVLDQFSMNLIQDFKSTLYRFLKVQTFGLENSRQTYRRLKDRLDECETPNPDALRYGVEILKSADRREYLRTTEKPVLVILGKRDSLVPVAVSESIVQLNSAIDPSVVSEAGHIPFVTHQEKCFEKVIRFLSRYSVDRDA